MIKLSWLITQTKALSKMRFTKIKKGNNMNSNEIMTLLEGRRTYRRFDESRQIPDEVITDIYRYILEEPGNYLKYYFGYLSLVDLKEKTKNLMGSDFSNKKFHELFLNAGPSDFTNLEKRIKKDDK